MRRGERRGEDRMGIFVDLVVCVRASCVYLLVASCFVFRFSLGWLVGWLVGLLVACALAFLVRWFCRRLARLSCCLRRLLFTCALQVGFQMVLCACVFVCRVVCVCAGLVSLCSTSPPAETRLTVYRRLSIGPGWGRATNHETNACIAKL